MKKRITISDVAQAAGVSAMSVSLAFHESARVSAATRQKILAAARDLHYIPNLSASQLRSGSTDMVGFLVQDFANPFHMLMMKHTETHFARAGMNVIFGDSGWDAEREMQFAERLIRMRVRGILLCPTEKNPELFRKLEEAAIPYVVLDSAPEDCSGCAVLNDLAECGQLAASHLIRIGAKEIVYVDAEPERREYSACRLISTAFRQVIENHGLKLPASHRIAAGMTLEAGARAFLTLRERKIRPDAVFCINDLCALGFMNEAEKHGLQAGRDFALAGIDDMDFSALEKISLTTIRQPYAELAEKAAAMLLRLMSGKTPRTRRITVAQQLIVRNTTSQYQPH